MSPWSKKLQEIYNVIFIPTRNPGFQSLSSSPTCHGNFLRQSIKKQDVPLAASDGIGYKYA